MSDSIRLSLTLSKEVADFVHQKVSSGEFADESEVINAGIDAIRAQEADLEYWLHNIGGPIYDRMKDDPSRGIPAEEVLRRIEERSYATQKSA